MGVGIIYTIPQGHCVIIQRLGKFSKVQHAGLNFRLPFIDKAKELRDWKGIAIKDNVYIELPEQSTQTEQRQCQTSDNVTIQACVAVYWKITDPESAVYNVDNLPSALQDTARNALRANVGKYTLNEILSKREHLNESISAQLSDVSKKWGIVFTRVEIQQIDYDKGTQEAMLQQMTAERKRLAKIAEAEGEAKAIELTAKAKADAMVVEAEGRARALVMLADAEARYIAAFNGRIETKQATDLLLTQKMLEGFETISKNSTQGDKIYLPSSLGAMRALIEA